MGSLVCLNISSCLRRKKCCGIINKVKGKKNEASAILSLNVFFAKS